MFATVDLELMNPRDHMLRRIDSKIEFGLVGNEPSSKVEVDIDVILVVRAICETHCEAFVRNDDIFALYKRGGDGGDWKDEVYP